MSDKLPPERKEYIEELARQAAREGAGLRDACPYPFGTPEAMHFAAVWATSLPKAQQEQPK
jgi:hypothetical protein